MSAEPYDSVLRWIVTSQDDESVVYLTDLSEGPAGTCTCPDFQCAVGPENKRTGQKNHCRHLTIARNKAAFALLEAMIERSKATDGELADQT